MPKVRSVRRRLTAALVSIAFAIVACGGGAAEAPGATPAPNATQPPAGATGPAGPAATPTPAAASPADVGPPAPVGTGTLDTGARVYAITVTECEFPADQSFIIMGTTSEGWSFVMTQMYRSGTWASSQIEIDTGPTLVVVLRNSAMEGAQPPTVNGTNVSWATEVSEFDVAANKYSFTGPGTLNVTCPSS